MTSPMANLGKLRRSQVRPGEGRLRAGSVMVIRMGDHPFYRNTAWPFRARLSGKI